MSNSLTAPSAIMVPPQLPGGCGLMLAPDLLLLQRHGSLAHYEAFVPSSTQKVYYFVALNEHATRGFRCQMSAQDRSGRKMTLLDDFRPKDAGLQRIGALYAKCEGVRLTIVDATLAYCQSQSVPEGDIFVTPTIYDRSRDAIVDLASGAALIKFRDGDAFQGFVCDPADAAGAPSPALIVHAQKALACALHDCDRRGGQDYCKRRLAWLVGNYALTAADEPILCRVTGADMEAPVAVPGLTDRADLWPQTLPEPGDAIEPASGPTP